MSWCEGTQTSFIAIPKLPRCWRRSLPLMGAASKLNSEIFAALVLEVMSGPVKPALPAQLLLVVNTVIVQW